MPLFFLIAVGLGAATVGATTVDVTGAARENHQARVQQESAPTQAQAYTVDTTATPPVASPAIADE
jgi:hypothetical protein